MDIRLLLIVAVVTGLLAAFTTGVVSTVAAFACALCILIVVVDLLTAALRR